MENYLVEIISALVVAGGLVVTATGFAMKNWAKFSAIYSASENAYHLVEEMALENGWTTERKIEEFELKFKSFMKWTAWAVNEKTLETAHQLAKAFCDKYRPAVERQAKKAKVEA